MINVNDTYIQEKVLPVNVFKIENNIVFYEDNHGIGIMKQDLFEKNFIKTTKQKSYYNPIMKKWSNWLLPGLTIIPPSMKYLDQLYKYRTNGKRVELICLHTKIRTSASCHTNDTFSLAKGLQLCFARMRVKEVLEDM